MELRKAFLPLVAIGVVLPSAATPLTKFDHPEINALGVSALLQKKKKEHHPKKVKSHQTSPSTKAPKPKRNVESPLPRGTDDIPKDEKLWRASTLMDLRNSDSSQGIKVGLRIVPTDDNGKPIADVVRLDGRLVLKPEDSISIELNNESSVPLYINLLSIDSESTVIRFSPEGDRSHRPLSPKAGWSVIGKQIKIGPVEGVAHFKVIASTKPLDLSALETRGAVSHVGEVPLNKDPLVYLVQAASLSSGAPNPGQWATAQVDILVRSAQ